MDLRINPTPIQEIRERLNDNRFFIKRDDILPISFGGNKVRKAVLFFDDLEKQGCDCIVTYGSSSSNHCRIVANLAASKGIPCYIISPNEDNRITNNSYMIKMFGAYVVRCPVTEVSTTIEQTIISLKEKGFYPYFIPGGGHGNIGTQAYVLAYKEILYFERSTGVKFDYIFHASGTGTTQAGLVCGKILYGGASKVIGISIARKNPRGRQVVCDSVNEYLGMLHKDRSNDEEQEHVQFVDKYTVEGYGSFNEEILETIKLLLIRDGIPMDTTYVGKAFWGMKKYITENYISNKNILFIHTGGTPLFFNDLEELINGDNIS